MQISSILDIVDGELLNSPSISFIYSIKTNAKKIKEGDLLDDGLIEWNEKYNKRLESKIKNKPCFTCKILPICGGGCSQISMENEGKEYCVKNFDENRKLQLVKNRFLNLVSTQ